MLVVDQMRADYIDRFRGQWNGGLRRLVDQGAWFRRAAYPYLATLTCTGHATIATGTLPNKHGIIGNDWFDRAAGWVAGCADDPTTTLVGDGSRGQQGFSVAALRVPTLADELRAQLPRPPRIVTLSVKERTAVMLAGRRGDAVTWFSQQARGFVSSTAYATAPAPFVQRFVRAHPVDGDLGKSWTPLLPAGRYLFSDPGEGEKPVDGWTPTFPHPLDGAGGSPDTGFYDKWEASPFSDAYLGRMAREAVTSLGLGRGPGTDYLAVSFTALDLVGHDFGPHSHEVQDTLARLDRTVGLLLATLDQAVGPSNYVVALTGDHGTAPIPEQAVAHGLDGGRVLRRTIVDRAQEALAQVLGPGTYVRRINSGNLYLETGVAERLRADPAGLETVLRAIRQVKGIAGAYFSDTLIAGRAARDDQARAAALSFHPDRSGDIVVVPRPYWFLVTDDGSKQPGEASTHGSPYAYDQRVPLVLYGSGIRRGEYLRSVTPADIAPTLAFLCGVTLADADGEVLTEAVSGAVPATPAKEVP